MLHRSCPRWRLWVFRGFIRFFFFLKNCGRKAFLYEMLLHFKMKAKIGQWHYCCCQVGAASRLSYYHQLAGFIFCEGVCVAQHSPGGQGICSTQHSTCLLSSVVAWIINSSKYNSLPVRITASSLVYLNEKQRVQKRILARGFQSCCWEIKVTYSSAAKLEGFHMLASCLFFSSVKKKMRSQTNINMSRWNYWLYRKKYMLLESNLDDTFLNR